MTEATYGFHAARPGTGVARASAADVKRKALELGADMVGIAALVRGRLYEECELSRQSVRFSRVVALGLLMDREAFRVSALSWMESCGSASHSGSDSTTHWTLS